MSSGTIIILNGAPRTGKSTLVGLIQERFEGVWINLGVDMHMERMLPPRYLPGLGLRPGGERPDLEALLPVLSAALFDSIAAHARAGLNVVADLGLHDGHSRPLGLMQDGARRLAGLEVLLVGLHAPIATIMARRAASDAARAYLVATETGEVPPPVLRWQQATAPAGGSDLELDTGSLSPDECLARIADAMAHPRPGPTAFERLAMG